MLSNHIGFFDRALQPVYGSYHLQAYFGLALYLFLALALAGVLATLAYLFSLSSVQDSEKRSEYECGFEPFDSATRLPFDVHFYLVGILFLIFDVEIALLFPWVLALRTCGWFGFYLMLGFILLLAVGFLYEWKRGALIWPARQHEQPYHASPTSNTSTTTLSLGAYFFCTETFSSYTFLFLTAALLLFFSFRYVTLQKLDYLEYVIVSLFVFCLFCYCRTHGEILSSAVDLFKENNLFTIDESDTKAQKCVKRDVRALMEMPTAGAIGTAFGATYDIYKKTGSFMITINDPAAVADLFKTVAQSWHYALPAIVLVFGYHVARNWYDVYVETGSAFVTSLEQKQKMYFLSEQKVGQNCPDLCGGAKQDAIMEIYGEMGKGVVVFIDEAYKKGFIYKDGTFVLPQNTKTTEVYHENGFFDFNDIFAGYGFYIIAAALIVAMFSLLAAFKVRTAKFLLSPDALLLVAITSFVCSNLFGEVGDFTDMQEKTNDLGIVTVALCAGVAIGVAIPYVRSWLVGTKVAPDVVVDAVMKATDSLPIGTKGEVIGKTAFQMWEANLSPATKRAAEEILAKREKLAEELHTAQETLASWQSFSYFLFFLLLLLCFHFRDAIKSDLVKVGVLLTILIFDYSGYAPFAAQLSYAADILKGMRPEFYLVVALTAILGYLALNLENTNKYVLADTSLRYSLYAVIATIFLFLFQLDFSSIQPLFNGHLTNSGGVILLKLLTAGATLFILVSLKTYFKAAAHPMIELPLIFGLALLFMLFLISSTHIFISFLSIVGFSLNLYILIFAEARTSAPGRESGVKYFYLSTFSSGLVIYGFFLLFLALGTGHFYKVQQILAAQPIALSNGHNLISLGLFFLLVGLFFKLSAFPGHLWAADVYDGAPDPVAAFFMLPVKVAVLALFSQLFVIVLQDAGSIWEPVVQLCAAASLIWGCFAALFDLKTKRFLAYASINQMGFLLLGIAANNSAGYLATLVYLFLYVVMNIIFLTVFLNARRSDGASLIYLTDFRKLSLISWAASFAVAMSLFSMAGIPPLAGFFGKYYLLAPLVKSEQYKLVAVALVTSLVSTYYYLRLIKILWFEGGVGVRNITYTPTKRQQYTMVWAEGALWVFILFASEIFTFFGRSFLPSFAFSAIRRKLNSFSWRPYEKEQSIRFLKRTSAALTNWPLMTKKPNTRMTLLDITIFLFLLFAIYFFAMALYHGLNYAILRFTPTISKGALQISALLTSVLVFVSSNPVNGLLSLISTFFLTAIIMLINQIEYFAFLVLIVYVGAIAILFLFVIMLLNIKDLERLNSTLSGKTKGVIFATAIASAITAYLFAFDVIRFSVLSNIAATFSVQASAEIVRQYITQQFLDILLYSQVLYTYFSPVFCLLALLLLTAMLGAIVLATSTTEMTTPKRGRLWLAAPVPTASLWEELSRYPAILFMLFLLLLFLFLTSRAVCEAWEDWRPIHDSFCAAAVRTWHRFLSCLPKVLYRPVYAFSRVLYDNWCARPAWFRTLTEAIDILFFILLPIAVPISCLIIVLLCAGVNVHIVVLIKKISGYF